MPAHVTVELDDNILQLVIGELELKNAPSFTLNHSGQYTGRRDNPNEQVRGSYDQLHNHVNITSQGESYEREGLYVLTKHLRFTVLHELRHAWQREHWTAEQQERARQGPYQFRHEEIDANTWAEYAMPKYRGLVRVTRQQVGKSGFARLSAHTNRRTA